MPNFIAIEITDRKLLVACAKTSVRGCQFTQLFEVPIEEDASGQAIGQELKNELAQRGVARAELIGLVSRQDAEMREVSVPPAPQNELPDLVRFQAKSIFASLNDSWLFDFVPFEQFGEDQQRVLAIAIPPQIKERFDVVASAAGMKLKRLVFRPFALCDLFEGMLAGDERRLLILPAAGHVDVMATIGNQMVAARSFNVSADAQPEAIAKQIVGETRRTISSTKTALGGRDVQQLIIGGSKDQWSELETELTGKIDLPVVFFAPMGCIEPSQFSAPEMPEFPERYSATLGALVKESKQAKHGIDFVNPRRPIVKKRDFRKLLIPLAAAGLFVLVALGYGWYLLNQQNKLIEAKRKALLDKQKLNAGSEQVDGTDQVIGEVAVIDDWHAGKVNWMDDLAFISEKLLTPDDVIISKFRGIESKKGYLIDLNSQVSQAKSTDETWQEKFKVRYDDPEFGKISQNPKSTTHNVNRPFKLTKSKNINETVEAINALANKRRNEDLEAESAEQPVDDSSVGESETEAG